MTNHVISIALVANTAGFSQGLARASAQLQGFERSAQASALGAGKMGAEAEVGSRRAAGAFEGLSRSAAKPAMALKTLSTGATLAGGAMLAGFGLATVATMRFDKQLSELAAVSGATGSELSSLRDQALEAGAATSFSASEAAQAQAELAKAGVSTADILGGALDGALALAAAGSLDLASSAEIAANAMQTFGLKGDDVTHIADVLASSANRSSADVAGLAQSLQQTGLVASQFGLDLEDTVGTLSAFAQAGLDGSDAGTSMKTMLSSFIPKSVEARNTMEQLGLSFFDAQGEFVGIEAAAEQLQTQLAGLTQEQRASALQTIFGSDAIRAATILYNEGGEGIADWVNKVDESGTAALMAQAKLNNLAGDLEALRGSLETALIGTGSGATGVLRDLTQTATGAVNVFNGMPSAVKSGVAAFAGLGGAALTAVGALGTLAPKVKAGRDALQSMGTAGAFAAGGLGKMARATVGVFALTTAAAALGDAIDPLEGADLSELENSLLRLGRSGVVSGEGIDAMGEDLDRLRDAMERVLEPSNLSRAKTVVNEVTTLGGLIGRGVADDLDEARKSIDDVDKALAQLASRSPDAAADAFREISSAMRDAGFSTEDITSVFDDYGTALAEVDTAQAIAGGSSSDLAGQMSGLADSYEEAESALQNYLDAQRAQFDPLFAALDAQTGITDAQTAYEDALIGVAEAQQAVNDAIAEHGRHSPEVAAAQRDLEAAQRGVEGALTDQVQAAYDADQAWISLADAIAENPALMEEASATMQAWLTDGLIPSGEAAEYVEDKLAALGMVAVDTAGKRVEIPVEERGGPRTRTELWAVRDAAIEAGRQSPVVNVREMGAALTFGWLGNVTSAAKVTGSQRPNVGVSESGSARTRGELYGVRDAAHTIPGARSTTVTANDQASSSLTGILGRLNALYDRTITITTVHRTIMDAASSVFPALRQERWGGIVEMADGGVVEAADGFNWRRAQVVQQPTVLFGERETGGEAYVPRRGDPRRSTEILEVAASWYGLTVVPDLDGAADALSDALAAAGGGVIDPLRALGRQGPSRWGAITPMAEGGVVEAAGGFGWGVAQVARQAVAFGERVTTIDKDGLAAQAGMSLGAAARTPVGAMAAADAPPVLSPVPALAMAAAAPSVTVTNHVSVDVRPTVGMDTMALEQSISSAVRREVDDFADGLTQELTKRGM